MGTGLIDKLATPPEVRDFLQTNNAEAAFLKVLELVRDCYPQIVAIAVELWDDPDEIDRRKVVFRPSLPIAISTDEVIDIERVYHERFVSEIPLEQCPLFGVILRFVE
ncbi:MAG: hypothetical protein L0Y72_03935 [Gemmataceae bacterium]|nr:hypothetical protein [Gemmataceae bacterium]MCI0738170.1 hypothetical protein [Gemmataceae bacterium]